ILIERPKPRAFGRQDFVDENPVAGGELTPFEFGVGDEDAAGSGIVGGAAVNVEAAAAEFLGYRRSRDLCHLFPGNVDVVAGFFFGGGREDRLGELLTLAETARQRNATDLAALAVLFPPRARQVATHHALDRHDLS